MTIWKKGISTFEWEYKETEETYILEGKARISSIENDQSVEFNQGDFITFPKGLKVKWEIQSPIRQHYHIGNKTLY